MCTVTYVPNNNNFIFTSNRDEYYKRKTALAPAWYTVNGVDLLFPKDTEAGGTWIAVSKNRIATILNGAFVQHEHNPPYKKSRGLVLLDSFQFNEIDLFNSKNNFSGIEPFTFIAVDFLKDIIITEIRWDAKTSHFKYLNSKVVHLWRSASLYTQKDEELKHEKFKSYLIENESNEINLWKFNLKEGNKLINEDIILKRNVYGVQTTATTQIILDDHEINMKYLNHLTSEYKTNRIKRI